jgi:hypothetical protein
MARSRRTPEPTVKRHRKRAGLLLLLGLAAGLFAALAVYMRSLERGSVRAALINDQVGPSGKLRPAAEVAQSIRSMKLVTVEVSTMVTSDSAAENWRGAVSAKVRAPVRLLYGADLSRLETAAYSPLDRTWLIRVPTPQRIATEVCTDSEQAEVEVGWLRLRSRAGEYYLGLARRDLSERAREMTLSPEEARFVRRATREQIESLVKKVVGPGSRVLVEFDDSPMDPPARGVAAGAEIMP